MSFAPADFQRLADRLCELAVLETGLAESFQRAAIGRYYYSVLLEARAFLDETSAAPVERAATTHKWVIQQLASSSEPSSAQLSELLNRMRRDRNAADYGEDALAVELRSKAAAKDARTGARRIDVLRSRARR